jgi:hypothetical protein
MLTADNLHDAADEVAAMNRTEEVGIPTIEAMKFNNDSAFHPPMDKVAIMYGIMIGIQAMKNHKENS